MTNNGCLKEAAPLACELFSLVIPTFNRPRELRRAILSALEAGFVAERIVVVDDHSLNDPGEWIRWEFPAVTCIRLPQNSGPGVARNAGLRAATGEWVVMLDDDDSLLPGALDRIASAILRTPRGEQFPCIQLARSNGRLASQYLNATLNDYLQGCLTGDFVPVIHRYRFLEAGLAYPDCKVGGENLLWFEIAGRFGLPTWSQTVVQSNTGAEVRLCSAESQLARPSEYAELIEATLRKFGERLRTFAPRYHLKKVLGLALYWVLAGNRSRAWAALRRLAPASQVAFAGLIFGIGLVPLPVLRQALKLYRSLTR